MPDMQANVDANRSANSNNRNANNTNLADRKAVKYVDRDYGAFTRCSSDTEKKPWDGLKETVSFRRLLESDGHKFTGTGKWVKCKCPFHPDRTPSFTVSEADNYAKCYGCGWKGNIFDYVMKFHQVSFWDAFQILEGSAPRLRRAELSSLLREKKTGVLTDQHQEERAKYLHRLATDEWLRSRICEMRANGGNQWNPDTLKNLALDGSLGWAGDALSFHYRSGTKYREFPGRRMIWDECNIGISMWREERIAGAKHIYIAEGETDAITLVDLGLEEDPEVAVIAIQGANSFSRAWAPMFEGKVVTLCFDNDSAGEKALEDVGTALTGVASKVLTVDLKEVEK